MSLTLSQVLSTARVRSAAPRSPLVFNVQANTFSLNGTALSLDAVLKALTDTAELPNGAASAYKRDVARCKALNLDAGKTGGNFRRLLRRLAMLELVQNAKHSAAPVKMTVDGNGATASVEYADGKAAQYVRDGHGVKLVA